MKLSQIETLDVKFHNIENAIKNTNLLELIAKTNKERITKL